MRRLSDVPWTSQRPPSSPSCPRWRRCGRRRAPRCQKQRKTSNLFSNSCFAHLTPSACEVMLVPCAWLLAAMIRNVPKRRTSRCCNMMLTVRLVGIGKRPVNRRAASQPARWQPEIVFSVKFLLFVPYLTCLHPLNRISDVDGVKECCLILRTKDPARNLEDFFCITNFVQYLCPVSDGKLLRAITFLRNFLITLAIVLSE